MRIGHIIKENLQHSNLNPNKVSLLTNISIQSLLKIISNEIDIDEVSSKQLGKLFGLEPHALLRIQHEYCRFDEKVTSQEKVIIDYFEDLNPSLKFASTVTIKRYIWQ